MVFMRSLVVLLGLLLAKAQDGRGDLGPVNEMDAPDDEYRAAHDRDGLWNHIDGEFADEGPMDEAELMEEWGEYMDDFVPDMLVTFALGGKGEEDFFQEVGPEAVLVRGGYFVSGSPDDSVEFLVTDPDGKVVLQETRDESLFRFVTTKAGVYSLLFSNHRWVENKHVTFALGSGNETALSVEHVNDAADNAKQIDRMLRDIQAESQYFWQRQKSQMEQSQRVKSRVFWLALVEFLVVILVVVVQVYYIKGLVSDRRMF